MTCIRRSLLSCAAILLFASVATTRPNYATVWAGLYPGSLSDDNVLNSGSACQLCHEQNTGGNGWNGYGWRVRQEMLFGGLNITNAILAVEPENGDVDPTLSSNLEEIGADTQPGWTDGAHNTIWFKTGNTLDDQLPPAAILGSLDPTLGDVYCSPAVVNSSGAAGRIAAKGSAVAADNDLTLVATDLPTHKTGYFLNSQVQGFLSGPGGSQGDLCLAIPIGRYAKQAASTGASGSLVLVLDLTNTPTPGGTVSVLAGETWNFQAWFRDKHPGSTSNFTDGLSVQFQ